MQINAHDAVQEYIINALSDIARSWLYTLWQIMGHSVFTLLGTFDERKYNG